MYKTPRVILCTLRVLLHPVSRRLLKRALVVLELIRNTRLDRIIRLRSSKNCPDQRKHFLDLVRGLPLVRTQHTQAHGAAVVVGHIRVVDLGLEADARWLERVVFGESDVDLEASALLSMLVLVAAV